MITRFANRTEAGRRLAHELTDLRGRGVVVLGLPRGGVPVAQEVALALGAALDVLIVRKLGVPSQPEVAMGAVAEGGIHEMTNEVLALSGVTEQQIHDVERAELTALQARERLLRRDRPAIPLAGRVAVIVDDGIATGATARVACIAARQKGAAEVIIAVPVISPKAISRLHDADRIISVEIPPDFIAVGSYYRDFSPTSDDEVMKILTASAQRSPGRTATVASRKGHANP